MKWLLFVFCAPWTFLVSWPLVLFFSLFAAEHLRLERNGLLTAIWRIWVYSPRNGKRALWRYSTTIGRGIIFQPNQRRPLKSQALTPTERHEMVHVRQHEDCMVLSFVVGLSVAISIGVVLDQWPFGALLGGALWTSGGLWQLPNFVASVLRYGPNAEGFYWSTEHERAARSQTEYWAQRCDIAQRECWADYDRRMHYRKRRL